MSSTIEVALYTGQHEAKYPYYNREMYPVSPGAWRTYQNEASGDYLANHTVLFDLGANTLENERDTVSYKVNGYALYTANNRVKPFYYDSLKHPITVNRNVTVSLEITVALLRYRLPPPGYTAYGNVRLALQHVLLGFRARYRYTETMEMMRKATATAILLAKEP